MKIPLAEWLPDLPAYRNPGLLIAKNAIPVQFGYDPIGEITTLALATLPARPRGTLAGIDSAANPYNFAGTQATLQKIDAQGLTDVTRTSGAYSCTDPARWEFQQFGQDIIAANPNDDMQVFNLITDAIAGKFSQLDADAPRARHIGIVGSFLVVGNTFDAADGAVPHRVWWPAVGNPRSWPTPRTDAALAVLSDFNDLNSDDGWVQAVVGGSEVGAIFQEKSVTRMDFVGGDVIFEFNRVEPNFGLLAEQLAIPYGREILFLSEEGWRRFDYTSSQNIGEEKINRTFLADLDTAFLDRISWAQDPDRPITYIAYPGAGNTSGRPNKVLIYNWVLNKWALMEDELEWVTLVRQPGVHLDTLPDDDLDAFEPTTSFDARQSDVGARTIGGYTTLFELASFSGTKLEGTFETGEMELNAGMRTRTIGGRPLVKGAAAKMAVAGISKSDATPKFGRLVRQNSSGLCPLRKDARYHKFRLSIPAGGWTEAVGMDIEHLPSGTR